MGKIFQIFKTALAAAISWLIAYSLLHGPYPYFAPLAAILTVQVTVAESVKKSWQRLLGTITGVIVSVLLSQWLVIGAFAIFLVITIGMGIGLALDLPAYVNSQAAVSSLMVLAFTQNKGYALGRITESIIGSVVGVLVNAFIFPPSAIPRVQKQIVRLSTQASVTLHHLATALQQRNLDDDSHVTDVTALAREAGHGIHTIQFARESLHFNPLMNRKRQQLTHLAATMNHLMNVSIQIRGVRRGLVDLTCPLPAEIEWDQLKTAVELTAACIKYYGEYAANPSESGASALQNHIEKALSAQEVCLGSLQSLSSLDIIRQVGAILTDLHRILEEMNPREQWNE